MTELCATAGQRPRRYHPLNFKNISPARAGVFALEPYTSTVAETANSFRPLDKKQSMRISYQAAQVEGGELCSVPHPI